MLFGQGTCPGEQKRSNLSEHLVRNERRWSFRYRSHSIEEKDLILKIVENPQELQSDLH